MQIRPVRQQDLPALINLYRQCFREPPWFEEFTSLEVFDDFTLVLAWPDHIFLVAEEAGQIVGGAIAYDLKYKPDVAAHISEGGQTIYMAELFVDKNLRFQGVGRALVFARLALARLKGYTNLAVRTSVDQPAIKHLYCDILGATVVAAQDVVSTKIIAGVPQQISDKRIIVCGLIPEIALVETLRMTWCPINNRLDQIPV
ncbi:MAG: hypothetical protein UX09_C0043G0008 [Candidatus Uhrbacteria bacterium GW2011_GWE2_45_35]|uniref:N-acetyltransferase domain-containing protein n=2 Tax=Candidatus Uhriibacteriota TaxID=1752732 RepID=A0A0G1LMH9_9BACT|nr:MAG: hypothetical protein UW63_C0040G0008 [Candidatus Uhrbacteria bacterium GW2011_GWF2_44_350]KKU06741.1 MAG: hypothetical protein UX09_C0043G0008 [Candidatus Uhrbacteria bacterium GW2011_GWE2_45_35]HBR80730.1 hypothetical protein [Candidatus Uhrbacteria bacterium]HCU32005.1 hypothetical protein [Candidatus Uhrbacteria bacterium]